MKEIPKLELILPLPPLIYCGCHRVPGHHFFVPPMRPISSAGADIHKNNLKNLCRLDTGFAPQDTGAEGEAWFHSERVNGIRHQVISFWDRSVDPRPGSHSTFLIIGDGCFNDAIAQCRGAFPEVFARFKFEVTLRRNMFL